MCVLLTYEFIYEKAILLSRMKQKWCNGLRRYPGLELVFLAYEKLNAHTDSYIPK